MLPGKVSRNHESLIDFPEHPQHPILSWEHGDQLSEIFPHLMGAGLLASRGVKERLEKHDDPIGFIQSLRSKE